MCLWDKVKEAVDHVCIPAIILTIIIFFMGCFMTPAIEEIVVNTCFGFVAAEAFIIFMAHIGVPKIAELLGYA